MSRWDGYLRSWMDCGTSAQHWGRVATVLDIIVAVHVTFHSKNLSATETLRGFKQYSRTQQLNNPDPNNPTTYNTYSRTQQRLNLARCIPGPSCDAPACLFLCSACCGQGSHAISTLQVRHYVDTMCREFFTLMTDDGIVWNEWRRWVIDDPTFSGN